MEIIDEVKVEVVADDVTAAMVATANRARNNESVYSVEIIDNIITKHKETVKKKRTIYASNKQYSFILSNPLLKKLFMTFCMDIYKIYKLEKDLMKDDFQIETSSYDGN